MSASSDEADVLTPQELRDAVKEAELCFLPEKSREKYLKAYEIFNKWRSDKGATNISETVLLSYLIELSQNKQPTTMWSIYSMLKATLKTKHNIHIETYPKLVGFLKRLSVGHKAKKSKVLTASNIERFLNEAPDYNFLATKLLQLSWQCCGRAVPEENVSVYTPTSGKSGQGDVYRQIANNIAERITSPIYRFLGIGTNKTEPTTKKPWNNIESFDEPEDIAKTDLKPVSNGLEDRDVEELSVEALNKNDKKPEKITLYSNYLPSKLETVQNDTVNEIDDPFEFDDDDADDFSKPREGGFVYYLELIGSFFQLALGAVLAIFKSSGSSN